MSIDYHRLVDGLSQAAAMVRAGAAGLAAIDIVVNSSREALAAVGATFVDCTDERGRTVAASGEMLWALGQPVADGFLQTADPRQLWAGPVDRLPAPLAERLLGLGVLNMASHPVDVPTRFIGAVQFFFGELEPDAWPQVRSVLTLVAASVGHLHAGSGAAVGLAGEEDDRTLFLAVAGHELRTPVTVVKGYASMLADRWESLDEQHRREAARVLSQRADDLARLVDRLLGASVGDDAGGWMVLNVPFDPLEALRRVLEDLSGELRRDLRLELPTSLPSVTGDPTLLPSIVGELVTNAVRASTQIGAPARSGVEIQAGADAHTVYIRVCDRGVGIDPTHVERAFERFWRARREGDSRSGVGLGLYLVRRLVERQNGWVSLRPREGGGTVAEVRLHRVDGPFRPARPGEA